jgi:ubiquinone/menaquinone biosynthesis C-methylase UbiE
MIDKKIERISAREGYDLWSDTYDSTPNPVVAMDSRHTIKHLAPAAGELILDAGCGTGRNLKQLLQAGSEPVGIDFSLGMLKAGRRKHVDSPIVAANLQEPLPFLAASFDAVLCALIGEHLTDLPLVLREFHCVLKPGGRLIFSVYHPEMSATGIEANFERSGIEYRLGAVHYTVKQHLEMFKAACFVDISVDEFAGDAQLASRVPSAAKYLNFPVLLILFARKRR